MAGPDPNDLPITIIFSNSNFIYSITNFNTNFASLNIFYSFVLLLLYIPYPGYSTISTWDLKKSLKSSHKCTHYPISEELAWKYIINHLWKHND